MSDLIVTYDGLPMPSAACLQELPAKRMGDKSIDGCQFTLPLVADDRPLDRAKLVRFDRQGDQFIPSSQNSAETLAWVHQHRNLSSVLEIIRLAGLMTRTSGSTDDFANKLRLVISQYIVTGVVRFPNLGLVRSVRERGETQLDLANLLLGSFTVSTHEAVAKTLGSLLVARVAFPLQVRERIEWVHSVLDLAPHYRNFTRHLVDETEAARLDDLPAARKKSVQQILSYSRKAVIQKWMGESLKFDKDLQEAFFAYQELYPNQEIPQQVEKFCRGIEAGLKELRGPKSGEGGFVNDCREGLLLSLLPAGESIPESLRRGMLSPDGLTLLQGHIARESEAAKMSIEWLHQRGRVEKVIGPIIKNIQINYATAMGDPTLSVNSAQLDLDLNLMIDHESVKRREYLLVTLASLERLFDSVSNPSPVRVFYNGAYRQVPWKIDQENRDRLGQLLSTIRKRLNISHRRTDVVLPVLEGISCAMGIIGVGLAEGLPQLRNNESARLGLGTTSASLLGGGCASLAGHFSFPLIAKDRVKNRFIWEGIAFGVGAAVGGGTYLGSVLGAMNGGPPPVPPLGLDTKFGVDERGR